VYTLGLWVLRNFHPWQLEVSPISTLYILPLHWWYKDKQGWVPLQGKGPIRYLPGQVLKELVCFLASMARSALWLYIGLLQCGLKLHEDHHRTTGQTHSDSIAFYHGTTNLSLKWGWIRLLIHTHTLTLKLLQFSFPPFGEVHDLWNSSWRVLVADQTPLPPSGMGPDWVLTFQPWRGCLLSQDKISRWVGPLLLGIHLVQDYSEGWNSRAKENPEYCWVAHDLFWSQVPPYSGVVQLLAGGSRSQKVWYLAGVSRRVVEILSDEKSSDTQRSGEHRFCFMSQVSSHSKFWAPYNEFTGFLKGSVGHQVTRNVLGLIDEPVLWIRAAGEICFGKFVYRKRQRKEGMSSYLYVGPFVLALDSFYGFTSNFSCSKSCLR
jgi:hypothetical protein